MIVLQGSLPEALTGLLSVVAGLGALAGALAVVTAPRAFRAVMGLLVTVVCLSVEYVLLAAPVIAFIQILVYAGAIVVLFLFVVMLLDLGLGQPGAEGGARGPVRWEWAIGGTAAFFTVGACGIYYLAKLPAAATAPASEAAADRVQAVGVTLFRDYLVSFEAVAVLLLAAVVAAIYMAHPRRRAEKAHPAEPDPPAEPGAGDAAAGVAGGKESS